MGGGGGGKEYCTTSPYINICYGETNANLCKNIVSCQHTICGAHYITCIDISVSSLDNTTLCICSIQ